ncbi:PREDICTED: probable E3 ubiquitin-protein ligase RHC1A [Ipomoea nil]|uniref:probable E3 ubiquitin-protein ligase RHC1A n=1 Tax=Ipomoea nil TaxID=35883 RepID=UPI000901334F|nr:PREDICTED: probable E3 ubiquitin-protein ligase RHC1A [Ipomoea nil]
MASSDSDVPPEASAPSLEEMTRAGARSMILPIILNFAAASPPSPRQRDVTVIVNARTGSITFIEGAADGKEGHLPASKASIEAMPVVKVGEDGIDCAICLAEFELGGEAKAMPCNHRYHPDCIDKWLQIHGSCPLCRYKMPAEEGEEVRKESDNPADELGEVENEARRDGGTERRERAAMVFHVFFRNGGRRNSDSDSDSDSDFEMQGEDTNQENPGSEDSEVAMEIDGR